MRRGLGAGAWRQSLIGGWAAVLLLGLGPAPAAAEVPGFTFKDMNISGRNLFDLGVVDVDDDLDLDLFTTNHLSRQSLLVNDGNGGFPNRLYELGLAQTPEFPGWEEKASAGPEPGLQIYHARSALHLRMVGDGRVRGTVGFLTEVKAAARGSSRAVVRREPRPGPNLHLASFRLGPDSHIRLDPLRMAQPFELRVKQPFSLKDVYVGASEEHPTDRDFTLQLRDRHGIAWADLAGGPATDAFIVRGGLQGRISHLVGAIEDELLTGRDGGFTALPHERVPSKGACRGRMAGAVDFSGDGRLDLFTTCRRSEARLFERSGNGFVRRSRGQLDADVIRWLDLDGDTGLEVLGALDHSFGVYDGRKGRLRRVQAIPGRQSKPKNTILAQADFDNDGDLDVYASSPSGSTFLRQTKGSLRARPPQDFGLPGTSLAAAWCDYDNDGLQDLLTSPDGLFRQSPAGTFQSVGDLTDTGAPREARLACADLDANGARDVVVAERSKPSPNGWETGAFLGEDPDNRWLELVLEGTSGNRQAIGARVRVRAGGLTQTQWVGQNETSLYSQGHYRVYFGLGDEGSASVNVRWPDGKSEAYGPVSADQVLSIER